MRLADGDGYTTKRQRCSSSIPLVALKDRWPAVGTERDQRHACRACECDRSDLRLSLVT